MIKALIDTNVVLDALASREPFREDAEKIFLLAAEEKFHGFVTANSITDIYYLVRNNLSEAAAREAIRHLLQLFAVVDINGEDCESALDSPIGDYEDALVAACAEKIGATHIITRDEKFLQASGAVSVVGTKTFLEDF
ncbi:PIN domain-containing protein [Desulfovibrio sp. OttesenSCG-928-C14]|nr:PIN domain-containing protein [Desulfovibrio sp. OttesenSCG-928-C14]